MIDSTPFRKQVANSLLRAAKQTAQCAREDRDDNDPDGHAHWTRMTDHLRAQARKLTEIRA